MKPFRPIRSVKQATLLLERFAEVDGHLAGIDEARRAELAKVNALFDDLAAAPLEERQALSSALAAWWPGAGPALTGGKRKSIELGGCEIGSRSSAATLAVDGNEPAIAKTLGGKRWAREMVRVTVSLDRAAVLKSLDGVHGKDLAELGLRKVAGPETVFVRRVRQLGTLSGAAKG